MNKWGALLGLSLLGGCAAGQAEQAPPVRRAAPAAVLGTSGLAGVIGRDARALDALFGTPDLDIREGTARKLQYASPVCVLDAYLYPPRAGGAPIVTHIDARLPDGRDMDRASCVAALTRRKEAR